MSKPVFHPLRVASVEPLTDDSVALTFAVPPGSPTTTGSSTAST